MDIDQTLLAQSCHIAAHDGTMPFGDIVSRLADAGLEGYAVDYRRNTTTYYLPEGHGLTLDNAPVSSAVEAAFDAQRIAALVRWAQSGAADYSYKAFCRLARAAGCAGYVVSFPGRRVLYYGRTAETHVEHFPR